MKYLSTQLLYFWRERQLRRNLAALLKYLALLSLVVLLFSVAFGFIMAFEGQDHSWFTGIYWTLTVMSTLGFGDITFTSDLGRAFSTVVLLSGIVMLLIVLPFAFIRHFYAPWLETRLKTRAPRAAGEAVSGHVVICHRDPIAPQLIERLGAMKIPYFLLEKDPAKAAEYHDQGLSVIAGDPEELSTWQRLRVSDCRAVLCNGDDARNTIITITVREASRDVPIVTTVDSEDSIDILELAGATEVLAVKQRLGELLANRVNAGHAEAHVIGQYRDLLIAEFAVNNTPLAGRTLRDVNLRQAIGVNIVGIWQRGRFEQAHPSQMLSELSVPVVVATREQLDELNTLLVIYDTNYSPAVVIGGGKVGCAASAALKRREIDVHIVERDEALAQRISGLADRVVVGDAADLRVLLDAGLADAPAVILSTNDDSINVYLAVYCRRLNPNLRIISRITHVRNLEAIHRAGADFVLSYSLLGTESVVSFLQSRQLMFLGSGVEFFQVPVPAAIAGETLADSRIGARTGMNVIALERKGVTVPNPPATQRLHGDAALLMLGTAHQQQEFTRLFR